MVASQHDIGVNASKLRAIIAAFDNQGFAVIDGGHFENLPELLKRYGLFGRSLFLDQADVEIQKADPWLVALAQQSEATEKVFSIVADKPAAIFWCCDAGEALLYRHLRTLNMARVPSWAANQEKGPSGGPSDEYVAVFFRHFDPRVLGALLPTVDAAQFARILGPSKEIAFQAPDFGGVRRVVASNEWPRASPGMLTIRSAQIEALNERRVNASHRRIADYLRDVAPEETSRLDDDQLFALIAESDRSGRQLGLESEQAHGRWAYVMVRTNGHALEQAGLREYITDGRVAPDEKMTWLLKTMAERMAGET